MVEFQIHLRTGSVVEKYGQKYRPEAWGFPAANGEQK